MNFKEISERYREMFGEMPPVLTTLDTNDPLYLDMLYSAIMNKTPLSRNDLAEVFMTDNKATY